MTSHIKCILFKFYLPKVNQSTYLPWPYLYNISGAKYSGVPHTDVASLLFLRFIFYYFNFLKKNIIINFLFINYLNIFV